MDSARIPLPLSTWPLPEEEPWSPASVTGLERSAHVLEKGGKVFSATLGLVDIVKGTNSYYKLQLLEDDKGSRCAGVRGAVLLEGGRLAVPSAPHQGAWAE